MQLFSSYNALYARVGKRNLGTMKMENPMDALSQPISSTKAATFATLRVLPYALTVFLGYLSVGIPLPVLPVEVHNHLGFGTVTAGIVVGLQAIAAILTRQAAGQLSDRRGAKTAALGGAALCAFAGLFYLAASRVGLGPIANLALLLLGRIILGIGDSLLLTGSLSWAIGALGPRNSGKVMVWVGIAMYGAVGIGAPLGLAMQQYGGFSAVALAAIAAPLLACLAAALVAPIAPVGHDRLPFYKVLGLVWRQGTGLAFATIGFSAIATFVALDYQAMGWTGAGFALTAFGAAYIAARLIFGHLPDRHGGRTIAPVSLIIEIAGLALLWRAGTPAMAMAAAALTGAGFSLVFPALGVEAVRRVPAQNRGAGLGAYVAFFDLGFGLGGPAMGLVAADFSYAATFAAGAVAAAAALLIVIRRTAETGVRFQFPFRLTR